MLSRIALNPGINLVFIYIYSNFCYSLSKCWEKQRRKKKSVSRGVLILCMIFICMFSYRSFGSGRSAMPSAFDSDFFNSKPGCCYPSCTRRCWKGLGQLSQTSKAYWTIQGPSGLHPRRVVPILLCQNWSHWYNSCQLNLLIIWLN